jgi:molybdopterin molybdotransferase
MQPARVGQQRHGDVHAPVTLTADQEVPVTKRHGFHGLGRSAVDLPGELEPIDRYVSELVTGLGPLPAEEVEVGAALGRVLAEEVVAGTPLPRFANSAMDGYVVRVEDLAGASPDAPVRLPVAGEAAAGPDAPDELPGGAALRIMTGAPVPAGGEAVVPVELTREEDGIVRFNGPARDGDHIRRAGEDVEEGATVLPAGVPLLPPALALLVSLGSTRVSCRRQPRVCVLSTGDEIVPAGHELRTGQLHDSNGPMLRGLVSRWGATPVGDPRVVPDDPGRLEEAIVGAVAEADLVVLSGGASAGAHDHVHDVLGRLGEVRAARLAMKPGKPQVSARVGGVPVVGVPGNPVSAYVSFELFVVPVLRVLTGRTDRWPRVLTARLGSAIRGSTGKRTFIRVRLREGDGAPVAEPTGAQGSHVLSSLQDSDGLAEVPEDRAVLDAGEPVRVRLWSVR